MSKINKVKCQLSKINKVKCQKSIRLILTERTSGVPPVIFFLTVVRKMQFMLFQRNLRLHDCHNHTSRPSFYPQECTGGSRSQGHLVGREYSFYLCVSHLRGRSGGKVYFWGDVGIQGEDEGYLDNFSISLGAVNLPICEGRSCTGRGRLQLDLAHVLCSLLR